MATNTLPGDEHQPVLMTQEIEAHFVEALEQISGDEPVARVHWVWEAAAVSASHWSNGLRNAAEAKHVTCYTLDGEQSDSQGYSTLLPFIIRTIDDWLERNEEQDWLRAKGPELLYLNPTWKAHPFFTELPDLTAIALSPSRRRLHKESEQMHRVTQVVVQLLLKCAKRNSTGTLFHFSHLELMDDHTLRCFARLARCAGRRSIVILATVSAIHPGHPRFTSLEATNGDIFLDRVTMRKRLLARVQEKVRAVVLQCITAAPPPLQRDKQDGTVSSKDQNAAGHRPGTGTEHRSTQNVLDALNNVGSAALEAALIPALEDAVFTQNYDHALYLAGLAWPYMHQFTAQTCREIWNHLALAYAFMENFQLAAQAFQQAAQYADTPVSRAENHFFLGLLYTKRFSDPQRGRLFLEKALCYLDGYEGEQEDVERAFIYNALALTYVDEKKPQDAFAFCKKALDAIQQGHHSPDATHIKINVISNIGVLYEFTGKLERALKNWMFFEPFLSAAGPVFAKHHYYRTGALLFKMGAYRQAQAAFEAGYDLATLLHDDFHQDILARAVAVACYREGDYAAAVRWYQASLTAKQALIQEDELPRVGLALALSREQRDGQPHAAQRAVRDVLALQETGEAAEKACEALLLWETRPEPRWQELVTWALEPPAIKLNRSFTSTNLY